MSATTEQSDKGNFGLSGLRLVIDPGVRVDYLATDALCLLISALGVFDEISSEPDLPDSYFAGLYLLRLASMTIDAAQMTPAQGEAAMAARPPVAVVRDLQGPAT